MTAGKCEVALELNILRDQESINYKIVRDEENPDFVIMTNRVVQTKNENNKIYKTCFKNYEGKIVAEVKRRNLILSAIKKYTK